jgi:hypothetical protein
LYAISIQFGKNSGADIYAIKMAEMLDESVPLKKKIYIFLITGTAGRSLSYSKAPKSSEVGQIYPAPPKAASEKEAYQYGTHPLR